MDEQLKRQKIEQLKYWIAGKKQDIQEHRQNPVLGFDVYQAYNQIIGWYEMIIEIEQGSNRRSLYT